MTDTHRIAIIEDEIDIAFILEASLEATGSYDLRVIHDPTNALSELALFQPELVLLDWMMPGIDGLTLSGEIAKTQKAVGVSIVLMTARSRVQELIGLANSVDAVLAKPFEPSRVVAGIDHFFRSGRFDDVYLTNLEKAS